MNFIYWSIIKLSRSHPFFRFIIDYLSLAFYKIFRYGRTFSFRGKVYPYFYHLYNRTVAGERIVEVPIAMDLLHKYQGKNILEIGNVMSHYTPLPHDILDKYEQAAGVINKDVTTYKFKKKYDLIISISTLEHVGRDYGESYQPAKFLLAVENLKKYLKPGGILFVTFPVSFNSFLRKLIFTKRMPFPQQYFLKRVSILNDWEETYFANLDRTSAYDGRYANADYLYVGQYVKQK